MLVFFNSASSYVQMSGNFPDLAMSQQSPRDWDHLDYEPEEVMEVEVEPAVTQGRSDEEVIQQILMESHSFSSSSSSEAGSGANTSGNPGPLGLSSSDVSFTSPSESSATVSSPTSASAAPSPDSANGRDSTEADRGDSSPVEGARTSTILLPVEMPGDEGIGLSRELVRLPQGLAASPSMVVQRLQEAWQGPVLRARQYGPRGFLHRPRPATSPPGAASPTAGSYSSLNSTPGPVSAADSSYNAEVAMMRSAPSDLPQVSSPDSFTAVPATTRGPGSPSAGLPTVSSPNSSGAGLLPAPPSDDESEDTLPTFCELCWREGHAERDCWGRCPCNDPAEPYPVHSRPDPHEPKYRPM